MSAAEKLLLASIHDVGPRFAREVDELATLFERLLDGPRFAMLVVPDHWGMAKLADDKPFQRRLRDWADAGVEMFVHGWFHKDLAQHSGMAAIKAKHMTASEGEFLGLSAEVAAQRMGDGRKLIEDIIGRDVAGFIAPAWLYGAGAQVSLAKSGFALAEDHFRVWAPKTGEIVAKGPVITWASRSVSRQMSSRMVASLARKAHGILPLAHWALPVARVAVHPGDTGVPALMRSIEATVSAMAKGRRIGRYSDLLSQTGTMRSD